MKGSSAIRTAGSREWSKLLLTPSSYITPTTIYRFSSARTTKQISAAAALCLQLLALLPRSAIAFTIRHTPPAFLNGCNSARSRSLELVSYDNCELHHRGGGRPISILRRASPSYSFVSCPAMRCLRLVERGNYRRNYTTSVKATLRCSAGGGGDCMSVRKYQQQQEQQADGPLALERVKNIRDLATVKGSGIIKGRVFRTGYLSEATKADADRLRDVTGLRTMVDLRSATEIERDELIHADVYEGFVTIGGDKPVSWEGPAWDKVMAQRINELFWGGKVEVEGSEAEGEDIDGDPGARRRYFVSLIDESIYKKGVFQRLRRRHKAAVMALAPAMMVSRRCTKKAREIFLRQINSGGLVLLNELLLQYSGKGINRVLRLIASRERHPVALYCTAGKDRTGLVMALTLAVLGVPDSAIVDDYAESDAAYKDLDDRDAMVGALAQEELDPDTFLCAPRHVMEDILRFIRKRYGSVENYLDSIGFGEEWRERLRAALLVR